jgi:endonuclease/exonuclease/phosphatase (EEP) superfamily protein YafD
MGNIKSMSKSQVLGKMRVFLLALLAIYVGLSYIGAFIYFVIESDTSRIELFKAVFELSLWITIPIAIILVLLKSWRLMLASLILVVIFAYLYVPLLLPRNPSYDDDLQQLKVMTFNTRGTVDELVSTILSSEADVVALQELSKSGSEALNAISGTYPFQALHPQDEYNVGQGIISRYPIQSDNYWEYPDLPHTLGHQRVEIVFNETAIAIYNTHPWPPLAWDTGFNDESHRVVMNDITQRTFAEDMPLLLVGDFNMTSVFEEYERLNTRFTDTFRVAGDGVGYTYPDDKYRPLSRLLRLDYIWHNEYFETVESTVLNHKGESDHAPVVSIVALKNSQND